MTSMRLVIGYSSWIRWVDLVSQFDTVDEESSVYSVGGQRHFMPYVPAYAVCGPADLALFSPADTD